jgi:hypothetical protein
MLERLNLKYFVITMFFGLYFMLLSSSCGSSFLSIAETEDPATDAILLLERQQFDEAIAVLDAALVDDPDNSSYKSLKASALVEKYGLDPLSFALAMAENSSSSDESSNGITSLFTVLPEATTAALAALEEATTLLTDIPEAEKNAAEYFKLSMFQSVRMVMLTKQFSDTVGGDFSAENLENLTEEQALAILDSLSGAALAVASANTDSEGNSGLAAGNITSIQASINSQSGSTSSEKLKNYLASGS